MKLVCTLRFSLLFCAVFLHGGGLTQPVSQAQNRRDYFVSVAGDDKNNGSVARPWRTIAHASEMIGPGATVHVAPGTYGSKSEMHTRAAGTSTARIRYVSDVQWAAKLVSSATGNSAVWANYGDYVDIEGFDISGRGALGIYQYASHARVIGNRVHNILATGACSSGNGGAGILNGNFSASDNDIIGNVVHDVGDYSQACPPVHGIYHANRGGRIANNIVYHNQGWGIHLWHAATHVTISKNSVFDNGYGGILIGAVAHDFPAGTGQNDFTVVADNLVYGNGRSFGAAGYGIEEYGDSVGSHNQYVNNRVYNNGPADWKLRNGHVKQ